MPTRIDNHAARAKKRLLAQFKEAPNLTALLARFGARYQAIDDAAYDILTAFTLDDATGDQLDLYGEVLSEARLGRTDNAYRVALKIRIVKNISKGEIPRLLQVYKYLMGADRVAAMETYPATLWLVAENQTVTCEEEADIIAAMNEIKAGGVQLLVGRSTGSLAFAFDGGDGLGFGEGDFADGLRTVCPVPATELLNATFSPATDPGVPDALATTNAKTVEVGGAFYMVPIDDTQSYNGTFVVEHAGSWTADAIIGAVPAAGDDTGLLILLLQLDASLNPLGVQMLVVTRGDTLASIAVAEGYHLASSASIADIYDSDATVPAADANVEISWDASTGALTVSVGGTPILSGTWAAQPGLAKFGWQIGGAVHGTDPIVATWRGPFVVTE